MLPFLLLSLVLMAGTCCLIGPALLPRRWFPDPLMHATVGIAAALVALYLFGLAAYIGELPASLHFAFFLGGMGGVLLRRQAMLNLWQAPGMFAEFLAWGVVLGTTLGWALTIVAFSGGGWSGDWLEHYERARSYVEHWPLDRIFIGIYHHTARPPLLNIVTAEFLLWTGVTFTNFQVIAAVLASIVYWPMRLLQRRFSLGGAVGSPWVLVGLLICLPLYLQNATFTWTKLPTAFFILLALALLGRSESSWAERVTGWVALTAGMLAHYSTGPWLCAVVAAELIRRPNLGWLGQRRSWLLGGACALFFATWLGWAVAHFGVAVTFSSNSTVSGVPGQSMADRIAVIITNVRSTIVPHIWREFDAHVVLAPDPVANLRDTFFHLYQSNVLFLAGSVGGLLGAWLGWIRRSEISPVQWRFWLTLIFGATFLGIAVNSGESDWGVAQICLQPLGLLGLAWLAASWPRLSRLQRRILLAGVAFDWVMGVVLHFAIESLKLMAWIHPDEPLVQVGLGLDLGGRANFGARLTTFPDPYLSDIPGAWWLAALCIGLPGTCWLIGLRRSRG